MSLLFALALQCLFPLFDSRDYFGFSLVNMGSQGADFPVMVTASDGKSNYSVAIDVANGAERAVLLSEVVPSIGIPSDGWVSVQSRTESCPIYVTEGNSDSFSGVEAAASVSTSLVLPHVEVNTGFLELAATDTMITAVNPGSSFATVSVQLIGLNGLTAATKSLSIEARGSTFARISQMFADELPKNSAGGRVFSGYIRLIADAGIAAWERVETPLSRSMLRGRTADEIHSTTLATLPHFVFGGSSLYGTILNLINPTSSSLTLELSARSDNNQQIGETVQIQLAAGASRRERVDALFRIVTPAIFPPPLISGYVRIRETQGRSFQVLGDAEIFTDQLGGRQSSMLTPFADNSSSSFLLPFTVSTDSYYTGYAIVNLSESQAGDITIDGIGSNAGFQEKIFALPPRYRTTGLLPRSAPGFSIPFPSGFVRITSTVPIHVLATIGSRDGKALDVLPAVQ